MHLNLIVCACFAGMQFAAANEPQHHESHHDKIVWVTQVKTVKVHPTAAHNWADGWGSSKGSHEHDHKDSKHAHEAYKTEHSKHEKEHTTVHHKPTHDSELNKDHHKDHKSKHEKNPSKSKHHEPNHTQQRAQGSSPSYGGGGHPPTYKKQVIHNHNVHRGNHSAPRIVWSDSLAATAQKIASGCVFAHVMGEDGGGYGQNIAAGAPEAAISHVISDQFYNAEINNFGNQYGVADPTGFESWGHFSQLVWKNTGQVGCATQYCPGGVGNTGSNVPPYFTVCNYSPPGNVANQYAVNIGEPLGRPTVRGHGAKGNHH